MSNMIEFQFIATLVIAFIFYTGFPIEFQNVVINILTKGKIKNGLFRFQKPFFCATCLTWWTCIAIALYYFSLLGVVVACVCAYFVEHVVSLLHILNDAIAHFFEKIYKIF